MLFHRILAFGLLALAVPAAAQFSQGVISSLQIVNLGNGVDGATDVRVGYEFPDPQPPCRAILFHVDGQFMGQQNVPEASGTIDTTLPLRCERRLANGSTHTITATPMSGGAFCLPVETRVFGADSHRAFTVQSPTIEAVSVHLDPFGGGTFTVTADFPFTGPFSSDDRSIEIFIDGVSLAGGEFHERQGTQVFPFHLGCAAPGTHAVTVIARRCYLQFPNDPEMIDTWTGSFSTPAEQGTVTITLEKDPVTGARKLNGTYELPPGAGSAELVVQQLPTPNENGTLTPLQTVYGPVTVTAPSGAFSIDPYTPPTGALQSAQIVATLSTCNSKADGMTAVPSGSCPGQPLTATNCPVFFADGNMRYTDADPLPPHLDSVALRRTYDSDHQFRSLFGRGWWSPFDARLVVHGAPGGDTIAMTTETNETAGFRRLSGVYTQLWPRGQDVPDTLTFDGSLYALRRAGSSTVSLYRATDGRYAGMHHLGSGREMRVEWSADGLPLSVTDSWTQLTWTITTDAVKRRITSIAAADLVWQYQYDVDDNLRTVLAPASAAWRSYDYVGNRMTTAHDADGHLIESHHYNAAGAATDSTGPGEEIQSIAYLGGGEEKTARVTMKTGAVTDYILRPFGGAYRTIRVIGGCSSCGARDSSYVYDAAGHLVREQNASGYVTVHTYTEGRRTAIEEHLRPQGCDPETDPNRCRLDPSSLATAVLQPTAATLKTDYEYADLFWPDKPTSMTTPSVLVAGASRESTTAYHPLSGQVTRTNLSGWTGEELVHTERGTSTAFYGDASAGDDDVVDPYAPAFVPGGSFQSAWLELPQPPTLPKSIDGPRTDADDVTLLVYYPVAEGVPPTSRGRLAATKNAAGHLTRYESYDLFGNATRIVDTNGVATEMDYDLLGRLETTTIKGIPGCDTTQDPLCATDLVSTRTYSPPAGSLASETRPGGGVTKYTYDTRGRVHTVSRGPSLTNLPEQLRYTYDEATGSKSKDEIFIDGEWKTFDSYAYDILGQLQTVTHAAVDGQTASASYAYDPEGRMASVRDETHTTPNTHYDYDPAGRIAAVRQTLSSVPGGEITTHYAYDLHGNLTSVTDPNGNVTSYVYDDFGQLIQQQSSVTGTTTYDYDSAGNLTRTIDSRGAATVRAYDALGRVLTAVSSFDGATETVAWTYDDPTPGRFGLGRIARLIDPAGTTDYR